MAGTVQIGPMYRIARALEKLADKATVGEGVLTIAQGETTLGTFSANATEDATIYIESTDSVSENETQLVTSGGVYNAIGRGVITLAVDDVAFGSFELNQHDHQTIVLPTTAEVQSGSTSIPTSDAVYKAIQKAITEVENGTY